MTKVTVKTLFQNISISNDYNSFETSILHKILKKCNMVFKIDNTVIIIVLEHQISILE